MTKDEHPKSLNNNPSARTPKKYKRRLIYVDPSFQFHTLIYFNGLVLLIIALLFTSLFSVIQDFAHEFQDPAMTVKLIRRTYTLFGVISLITLICTNLVGLLFTHRISGPLVRLKNHLEKAAVTGDLATLAPLNFRENDFFQELPDLVNKAFKSHGKKD